MPWGHLTDWTRGARPRALGHRTQFSRSSSFSRPEVIALQASDLLRATLCSGANGASLDAGCRLGLTELRCNNLLLAHLPPRRTEARAAAVMNRWWPTRPRRRERRRHGRRVGRWARHGGQRRLPRAERVDVRAGFDADERLESVMGLAEMRQRRAHTHTPRSRLERPRARTRPAGAHSPSATPPPWCRRHSLRWDCPALSSSSRTRRSNVASGPPPSPRSLTRS